MFIFSNQVVILRPVIDREGIRKDLSKVKDATDLAAIEEIATLRRFLGLIKHLMKFCPNWA